MDLKQIPNFAILSGLFGTAASVFGKFISYSDEFLDNIPIDTSQNVMKWLYYSSYKNVMNELHLKILPICPK